MTAHAQALMSGPRFSRGKYAGWLRAKVAQEAPGYILWNIENGSMLDELDQPTIDIAKQAIAGLREALVEAYAGYMWAKANTFTGDALAPYRQAVRHAEGAIDDVGGTEKVRAEIREGVKDEAYERSSSRLALTSRMVSTTAMQKAAELMGKQLSAAANGVHAAAIAGATFVSPKRGISLQDLDPRQYLSPSRTLVSLGDSTTWQNPNCRCMPTELKGEWTTAVDYGTDAVLPVDSTPAPSFLDGLDGKPSLMDALFAED